MAVSSILNDVIGPVMRGPSSSHTAAACRIGLLARDLIAENIKEVIIDYDPSGSLVTTHESHGSDLGLYSGLLGWSMDDERMLNYREGLKEAGIKIKVNYINYGAKHPNTYRMKISNSEISHTLTAISTGGGAIEIIEIDGAEVSINGDFHELLIYTENPEEVQTSLPSSLEYDFIFYRKGRRNFIEVKSHRPLTKEELKKIKSIPAVMFIRYLKPVLPVLSRKDISVPFLYCSEMLKYAKDKKLSNIWELAVAYESERGGISEKEVMEKMREIVRIMKRSIKVGLKGTHYEDRILPAQSPGFKEKMEANALLDAGMLNTMILYTTAMMEVKSSMGVIVAAPTAGACGTLPGAILGAVDWMGKSEDEAVKAMLAAGIIGIFISEHATFSAEVGGCQAETGAASTMAAAGLAYLAGGNLQQCVNAASFALQNELGLICDPIANRVEAPCLGRNIMGASNALASANMALANYDPIVPLDEVVETMLKVGRCLPHELRCTGLGGLSITPSSKTVERRLKKKLIQKTEKQ